MVVITIFVFAMMLLVDYFNVLTKGKMEKAVRGNRGRQYVVASFLGSTPGCLGAFMKSFSLDVFFLAFYRSRFSLLEFIGFCSRKYRLDSFD